MQIVIDINKLKREITMIVFQDDSLLLSNNQLWSIKEAPNNEYLGYTPIQLSFKNPVDFDDNIEV